jgi:hypothetical protein
VSAALRRSVLAAAAALSCAASGPARGEQTRVAVETASEIQRGEADGIAVTSRGKILLAPQVTPLTRPAPDEARAEIFDAKADGDGNVLLATGPDGEVVRVGPDGKSTVPFKGVEPLVTAVLPLHGGGLLAATAPGGKIYKILADGKSSVWCETQERYVWAMAEGRDGVVFAATGDRGRLLKIDRNGKASTLFDADETHLVSLVPAGSDGFWVGGSARGLVYHVDGEGHALVIYDDELPEARAILPMPGGDLVVAFDAPPISEKRPPALRLRVAGGSAASSEGGMGDLESRSAPALQGVIEGLTGNESEETVSLRGKVVRITRDGAATELWRSRIEAPFALALDDQGRPLFATGEPAKLWRVEGPGETALLATLAEGQITSMTRARGGIVAAASNPAATYKIGGEPAESGTFLSPPSDAGSVARWGTLSWRTAGSGGRVEMFTRTGNCEDPDGTWSAWSPAQTKAEGSAVANPDGRFLQWRARILGGGGATISSVAVTYATKNRAPSIRDFRIEPAAGAISGKATFRWSTADPDGDGVTVDVQARASGSTEWKSAVRTDPTPGKLTDPTLGNDGSSKDGKGSWDTSTWEEGAYDVRAVASDQASNPQGEGLEAESGLPTPVIVDRTPPSIDAKRKGGDVVVSVEDALSSVARLDVVLDGRVMFSPRCADGVCDSTRETFRFPASRISAAGTWSLRATDAAGNAVEAPVPSP